MSYMGKVKNNGTVWFLMPAMQMKKTSKEIHLSKIVL